MKTLHFDCFAGISGDMALGAFVDLGVDADLLRKELGKLGVGGWKLAFVRDERCGIGGTRAVVELTEEPHDHHHDHDDHGHDHHDHQHSYGHAHGHEHAEDGDHHHDPDHHHGHDPDHHHGHGHEHGHNTWREIRSLIEAAPLREGAKRRALDIFSRIAEAEGEVHGVPTEDVAFHEVGALDSIIDIVGAAICLDLLAPDRITASEIELGGGTVTCAHGVLPVPAPATLRLCRGLPVRTGGFLKEMTTPTGAAILASCVDEYVSAAAFTELKTAYGIGTRKLDKPNVLRLSWREDGRTLADAAGRTVPEAGASAGDRDWETEELVQIEANVDDMSGEAFGFLMERLFEAGALDAGFTPCVMKKGRPGTTVSVLCRPASLDASRRALFRFSTTIGFKEIPVRRLSLRRREEELSGSFGSARVKVSSLAGDAVRAKIEYEDRARVARERNCSLDQAERLMNEEGKGR